MLAGGVLSYWLRQGPTPAHAALGPVRAAVPVSIANVARQDVPIYLTGLGTVQASATGVSALTVEFLSQGHGINISVGSPQANIQIKSGFNVYKIPLSELAQPAWAPVKVSTMLLGCIACSG